MSANEAYNQMLRDVTVLAPGIQESIVAFIWNEALRAASAKCTESYRTIDGWGITDADQRCSEEIMKLRQEVK